MLDDNDHRPIRVLGTIQLEIAEDGDGKWLCIVSKPRLKTNNIRKIYKMALITADVQVHVKDRLPLIDRIVLNNAEIAQYHELQQAEKLDQVKPDTERYQTKLPFGEKTG